MIRVTKSRTVNLGNYNSTKFEYGIEEDLPDDITDKEIQKRQEQIDTMVDHWIETEHGKWQD